jgi:HlyD family secretion protein
MAKEIFRQAALERLSSPERLDALMTVTTPRAWLGLIAGCVVIAGAVVWGFVGRTPDTIDGAGILHRRGGLFEVQSLGAGTITELTVKAGDLVTDGQVVAHIGQPELERNIAQSEARLGDVTGVGSESSGMIKGNRELEIKSAGDQLVRIEQAQKDAREQLAYLEDRLKAQDEAVRRGLINRDLYQTTNVEASRTRDAITGMDVQKTQLQAHIVELRNQASQGLFTLDRQIQTERHQLELLRLQHERTSTVRSPYNGRIVEMQVDAGNAVRAGQPLMALELQDQDLDCFVFVPLVGKRITPGMPVRITPSGISWEEYGYLVGRVVSVSDAPLSPTAMNVYLRNDTLVQQFSAHGGAYLVNVAIEKDAGTSSGLKWTTHAGPPQHFGSGTLLTASVTIREQRPIALVIPALRRWLGF